MRDEKANGEKKNKQSSQKKKQEDKKRHKVILVNRQTRISLESIIIVQKVKTFVERKKNEYPPKANSDQQQKNLQKKTFKQVFNIVLDSPTHEKIKKQKFSKLLN